jgi:hypothetical protein
MTKILNRIHKLLALATSSNVNEAAVAAAQAQKLIARHRIDQAQLDNYFHDFDEHDNPFRLHDDALDAGSRVAPWHLELAMVVAEANGCRVVVLKEGRYSTFKLVGHEDDVASVRALYAWLSAEIERISRSSKQLGKDSLDTFRLGAISTIEYRLDEANATVDREALKTAKPDSKALVRMGLKNLERRSEEAERLTSEICEGREEGLGEFGEFDAGAFVDGAALAHTLDLSGHQRKLEAR